MQEWACAGATSLDVTNCSLSVRDDWAALQVHGRARPRSKARALLMDFASVRRGAGGDTKQVIPRNGVCWYSFTNFGLEGVFWGWYQPFPPKTIIHSKLNGFWREVRVLCSVCSWSGAVRGAEPSIVQGISVPAPNLLPPTALCAGHRSASSLDLAGTTWQGAAGDPPSQSLWPQVSLVLGSEMTRLPAEDGYWQLLPWAANQHALQLLHLECHSAKPDPIV